MRRSYLHSLIGNGIERFPRQTKTGRAISAHFRPSLAMMAVVMASVVGGSVSAANLYLDVDSGNTLGTAGGTINWDTTTATWNNTAGGTGTRNTWSNANTPVFDAGGNAYALSTTTAITIVGATVINGAVTIQNGTGGSLALAANSTFDVAATKSLTIVSPMSGSFGVIKANSGTLTLSGANSYTGPTTINAGTLQLGASNVLPATRVVLNGGTLDTGSGNSATAGALDVNGAATINLNVADSLAFAASNTETWTGTLAIWNWEQGSTSLRFGTNATGLTSTQLSSISVFTGSGSEQVLVPFGLDTNGFLVPVPEPGAVVAALALLGVVGWRERRSFLRVRGCAA